MRPDRVAWCLALCIWPVPAALLAQGYQLNEVGSCAVARAQAVVGAPCKDPSSIYWNPAATVDLRGWSAYASLTAIAVGGDFTADTSGHVTKADVPASFPPALFVNYGSRGGRWAAGVGAYVPYGLSSQWPEDFSGRFEAQKASLFSLYVQPNFAYRFATHWSIGGGPVIGYAHVQLVRGLDLATEMTPVGVTFGQLGIPARTQFAQATLEGSATAFGFNVAIHGTIGDSWEIGARYLSKLDFKYNDATASFTQTPTGLTLSAANPFGVPANTPVDALLSPLFDPGATLSRQKASSALPNPAQFEIGVGYTGLVNTTLSADFTLSQFSVFQVLPITFHGPASAANERTLEDYNNSWSVRAGVEHAFAIGIKGRAGVNFVKSPAPDVTVTPELPDQNRMNYTVGAGVPLSPRYTLDIGYLRVQTSGRRGRVVQRTDESQTAAALNSGFYRLSANVFSLSVRANF
ncbi:MAG TPA: outer membrane protein transport protein [Gemmatimonadaceae bacterium]|nr:outer membrane protein transport protein [Gemmatimonadaceae bacterium]